MDALLKELPVHQSLARVFSAIGDESFWRALADCLRLLVPLDNVLVAQMRAGRVPVLLADFEFRSLGEPDDLVDYQTGMYLLDPFYQAACAGVADGLYSLASIAPDQFQQSEYYLSYFRQVVGCDEAQFLLNHQGAVFSLSLGRSPAFSQEEFGRLLCVRDWVLAAMHRHLQLMAQESQSQDSGSGDLNMLLERVGARLTEREVETVRLILLGFSGKAIAQRLGISPETVKVHRRNLYHKLGVSGHAELFALLLRRG